MKAASYDHWYDTPRGRWIGRRDAELALEHLQPYPGESLLDVGCGAGFFTRTLAASMDGPVVGVDIDPEWVEYARRRASGRTSYAVADARALPYPDASFDLVVSIAAVSFIENEVQAIREMLRVARRRVAIGLLNRHSLLWLQKGRSGGHGAYRGARWHTIQAARNLLCDQDAQHPQVRTAIQLPGGGRLARVFERTWPSSLSFGAFILVVGDVAMSRTNQHDDEIRQMAIRTATV